MKCLFSTLEKSNIKNYLIYFRVTKSHKIKIKIKTASKLKNLNHI